MRPAPRTMSVVIVVVPMGDGRYVFVEEAKDACRGQWALPGGVVEIGESIADAVVREVQEEAGLLVEFKGVFRIEQFVDVGAQVSKGAYEQKYRYLCVARPESRTLKSVADSESIRAAALTIVEARRLTMRDPGYLDLLAQFDVGAAVLQPAQIDFRQMRC